MHIFWRIRYLDRRDRQFKDRDLFVSTNSLDPATKAAVEFAIETKSGRNERELLRFRWLFSEGDLNTEHAKWEAEPDHWESFCLSNYFEDENGVEIDDAEMALILTGKASRMIPAGTPQHCIELMLSTPIPIPVSEIALTPEQLHVLGYFVRDIRELDSSAFMQENPATLTSAGGSTPVLTTSASDDEIRSFVTIFRRLYMDNEPANYLKATELCSSLLANHPYGRWIAGERQEYLAALEKPPKFPPNRATFPVERLIDVFLYTQYHHQPNDAQERPSRQRQRQFNECLAELGGRKAELTWMFLSQLWTVGHTYVGAGRFIAAWFSHWSKHHGVTADVLASLLDEHPGIGSKEKERHRKQRILQEKIDALARSIWKDKGCPPSGHQQFLREAEQQLRRLTDGDLPI